MSEPEEIRLTERIKKDIDDWYDEDDTVNEILRAVPPEEKVPYLDSVIRLAERTPGSEIPGYGGFDKVKSLFSKYKGLSLGLVSSGGGGLLATYGATTGNPDLVALGTGIVCGGVATGYILHAVGFTSIHHYPYKSRRLAQLPLREYRVVEDEYW